jgi:hypothetical protein
MTITPTGLENLEFAKKSRLALWHTQSLYKAIQGALPLGVMRPEIEAQHSHLVPTLQISGAIPLLPPVAFKFYLFIYHPAP